MNGNSFIIITVSLLAGITAVFCAYLILHWKGNTETTIILALLGAMMGGFGIANAADQTWQEITEEE